VDAESSALHVRHHLDSIIFATAARHDAGIVTGDADFDGLPGVTLIR